MGHIWLTLNLSWTSETLLFVSVNKRKKHNFNNTCQFSCMIKRRCCSNRAGLLNCPKSLDLNCKKYICEMTEKILVCHYRNLFFFFNLLWSYSINAHLYSHIEKQEHSVISLFIYYAFTLGWYDWPRENVTEFSLLHIFQICPCFNCQLYL